MLPADCFTTGETGCEAMTLLCTMFRAGSLRGMKCLSNRTIRKGRSSVTGCDDQYHSMPFAFSTPLCPSGSEQGICVKRPFAYAVKNMCSVTPPPFFCRQGFSAHFQTVNIRIRFKPPQWNLQTVFPSDLIGTHCLTVQIGNCYPALFAGTWYGIEVVFFVFGRRPEKRFNDLFEAMLASHPEIRKLYNDYLFIRKFIKEQHAVYLKKAG